MESKKYKSSMEAGNYDPNIDGINSVLNYINFIEDSINSLLQGMRVYARTDIPQWDDIKFEIYVAVESHEKEIHIGGRIVYIKNNKKYTLSPFGRLKYKFEDVCYEDTLYKALVQFNSTLIRFLKYGKGDFDLDTIFAGNSKLDLYHFDKKDNKTFNEEIGYNQYCTCEWPKFHITKNIDGTKRFITDYCGNCKKILFKKEDTNNKFLAKRLFEWMYEKDIRYYSDGKFGYDEMPLDGFELYQHYLMDKKIEKKDER